MPRKFPLNGQSVIHPHPRNTPQRESSKNFKQDCSVFLAGICVSYFSAFSTKIKIKCHIFSSYIFQPKPQTFLVVVVVPAHTSFLSSRKNQINDSKILQHSSPSTALNFIKQKKNHWPNKNFKIKKKKKL